MTAGAISVCFACGSCRGTHAVIVEKPAETITFYVPAGWILKFDSSQIRELICPRCQSPDQRKWVAGITNVTDAEVMSVEFDGKSKELSNGI